MCDTCGKAFRVAANFYAHRKIHRESRTREREPQTAALDDVGVPEAPYNDIQQPEALEEADETQQIHTLQMAQPVAMNDALSQAIREHLTQTGLSSVHLDSLQPYDVSGSASDGQCIDYASIHPDDQQVATPGYIKQILLGQFEDKD